MAAVASSSTQNGDAHPPRYALARSILGQNSFQRINTAKILVVGAGGIGCELLKNLALTGFGNIEVIDLDTIDLSNLNRQFLFQKQHIKKPKSIVAKQTATSFNPHVNIVAHHANIKEPRFGVAYFQRFDLVMNALDNLDARRWVNKMCLASSVPLIESGTTGFLGQVQPIKGGVTACYDCTTKETPKSFPICTIRSTPSAPIHCIVWAKSWLFVQLFGEDDESEDAEFDKAIADGEDAKEIDSLRKEAREMRDIRAALVKAAQEGSHDAVRAVAERIFNKVYKDDIERLLGMEEMWANRPIKPTPLVFQDAINGDSTVETNGTSSSTSTASASTQPAESSNTSTLKDQQKLSLKDNVELFLSSLTALAFRAVADLSNPLSFDKDDDDALDFVTASSNLRSLVYKIDRKTRFDVKQMAGNIIPAIASTNAIISGLLVLQALHVLRGQWAKARCAYLLNSGMNKLSSCPPNEPNEHCGVCQDMYIAIAVRDLNEVTLEEVVEGVRGEVGLKEEEIVVYNGQKILADPDFEDNLEKSLQEMGLEEGAMLTITDEDMRLQAVNIVISLAAEKDVEGDKIRMLTSNIGKLRPRPVPKAAAGEKLDSDDEDPVVVEASDVAKSGSIAGKKRSHPDDLTAAEEGVSAAVTTPEKKRKTSSTVAASKDGSNANAAIELD